ncbi:MAG TPA: HNH endonuclease signature motif containing protein [Cellulomonas sp.]
MVALEPGSGREVAGLPLPQLDPTRRPLLDLGGDMAPEDASADPVRRLTAAVAQADLLATAAAAFRDELVATAYREGAAEYAARLTHPSARERREWGARGMLAELACALRMPEGTLARRLARQAALAAFPRFCEANAAGLVSSWHCDVMLDIFGGVDDEAALAAADEALVGKALAATASELRVAARRWRARHIPRTEAERDRNLADRRVEVSAADDDLCWLSALLPAAQAMAIYHRLSDIASTASGPAEPRTLPQLRADAMCELLLGAPAPSAVVGAGASAVTGARLVGHRVTGAGPVGAGVTTAGPVDEGVTTAGPVRDGVTAAGPVGDGVTGAGPVGDEAATDSVVVAERATGGDLVGDGWQSIRPTVVLTVPALSLLGRSDEPADLEGFGPIDIETARELCALAPSLIRVLTHPETGAVLSVGRDRYRVPADLRTALVIRDETCRFPGCRRRAVRCDLDHATAWEHGGGTAVDNLEHLCRKHHRLKHELRWTVTHDGGGTVTWTSPVGGRYRTEPAVRIGRGGARGPGPPPAT